MITKLIKYLIIGTINFGVWFCIIWLMARMGFSYIIYTACAYIISMISSFFLNLYFTFAVSGQLTKRIVLFFSFNLTNLLCVEVLQYQLIEYLHVKHNLAILAGMVFYTLTGFLMNYFVVYHRRLSPSDLIAPGKPREKGIKSLYICADDYAQNEPISEGILNLLTQNRINATSCLVNSPEWEKWGKRLLPLAPTAFIGLHLNFTHGNALSQSWREHYGNAFKSLSWIIANAYTRRLNKHLLKDEIKLQLKRFIEIMGFFPDFIDGHQHIHQLPMIRDMLLEYVAKTRHRLDSGPTKFFYRTTAHHWHDCFSLKSFPKRAIIACLGGLAFKKLNEERRLGCVFLQPNILVRLKCWVAKRRNPNYAASISKNQQVTSSSLQSNTSFSGIYNFAYAQQYRYYFQQFLQESKDGGLIMCHPGLASEDTSDPLNQSRVQEMHYFLSEDYIADMQETGARLFIKPSHNK